MVKDSQAELKLIDEKISAELEPYLDGLITRKANFEQFKKAYLHFYKRMRRAIRITISLGKESQKVTSDPFYLFIYLGIVESLGNSVVDLAVLLLVANGRDFHIECQHTTPRIKHAQSIEDLETERVPLTTKLNFIKDNNLNCLASLIDTDLRNDVAHLKFEVKNGDVFVKKKKGNQGLRYLKRKEIDEAVAKMVRGTVETARLIDALMKKKGVEPPAEFSSD